MVIADVVEGQTSRVLLQLKETNTAGITANLDGTGLTVSDLVLTGSDGRPIDTSGDFGWATQASGLVYYDPDAADFVAAHSPYRVRVQLTDAGSKIRYYPDSKAAEIRVHKVR